MSIQIRRLTAYGKFPKLCAWFAAIIMAVPLAGQTQNQYVGAERCAACHAFDKQGDMFRAWQTSKHAAAYRTLVTDSTKAEAEKYQDLWIVKMGSGKVYGLPTPAAEAPECLPCHATAANVSQALIAPSFNPKDGVQCESCHGPGSAHAEVETIKRSGKAIPAEDVARVLQLVEVSKLKTFADENEIRKRCQTCHDGMCGDFSFDKMWPMIKHSSPKELKHDKP